MSQSPILISRTGNGPTTALDLRTIPEDVRLRILCAANLLAGCIGDGRVTADDGDNFAGDAVDELAAAISALDGLFVPTVPRTARYGAGLQQGYPVIRDGEEVIVPIEGLTELELVATQSRIRLLAAMDFRHADELEASRAAR